MIFKTMVKSWSSDKVHHMSEFSSLFMQT